MVDLVNVGVNELKSLFQSKSFNDSVLRWYYLCLHFRMSVFAFLQAGGYLSLPVRSSLETQAQSASTRKIHIFWYKISHSFLRDRLGRKTISFIAFI